MTATRRRPGVAIEPRALDLETAASVYALGESALRHAIDHLGFPVLRVGRRVVVPVAAADAWLAARAAGEPVERAS